MWREIQPGSSLPHEPERHLDRARRFDYNRAMSKLLDQALKAVRQLSPAAQDEIARAMLALAGTEIDGQPVPLSPEERVAISLSKAAAARCEFATDEQVRATWAKHGL
jgi:hypothetical protein